MRFELTTLTLARLCSTPELRPHPFGRRRYKDSFRQRKRLSQKILPSAALSLKPLWARQFAPIGEQKMTTLANTAETALLAFLDDIGVSWTLERHIPLFTVEDSKAATGHMPGAHTKNLFLKQKKGGYVLVVCLEDRAIRIKHLEKAVGMKRLSFGSAEALNDVLGVIPGSVTPFGAFNDRDAHQVTVILDQQMLEMDPLNYHPLHNEATVTVDTRGLQKFFQATGHTPIIVDFDALEALSAKDSVS